jgi:transcriptional regulator with XRE-family HTH domain
VVIKSGIVEFGFMELNESDFFKEISERIKYLRKLKGYSSHETFAFDNGIPRKQYWRMEKGTENITMRSLVKILQIHNLRAAEFFSDDFYRKFKSKK